MTMRNLRASIAVGFLTLVAALLVGVSPASAVGNYKCDTNSPQWDVDMCVRTNASRQTDGSGLVMDNVRVWATGDPSTLEDCPAFTAWVIIKKPDGTERWESPAQSGCKSSDYSRTFDDFRGLKVPEKSYVVVKVQMYDNGDPDPGLATITLDVN